MSVVYRYSKIIYNQNSPGVLNLIKDLGYNIYIKFFPTTISKSGYEFHSVLKLTHLSATTINYCFQLFNYNICIV